MYKEYKVGDLVHFDNTEKVGVGKVVGFSGNRILVHSPSIDGHNGYSADVETQDNNNNWFFVASDLSPFTKKVGQRYTFIGEEGEFEDGETVTLIELYERCSRYSNGINNTRLYDVNSNACEPEVQYLDEGFTQQDLEVGMLCETENNKWWIVDDEVERDLNKNNELVVAIYKKNDKGDLIKIWKREEELFTLEGSFTKEETIKIGEHLDWKKVK